MPQKIQIKRGNKNSLPKLNLGEPAFSIDTKEFFIGNRESNQLPQTRENLMVNGNFQVVCETFDAISNKIILLPGTSRFLYGNFYISNSNTSIGNVTISRPDNGYITIECTNAQMSFEYREKLAEYLNIGTQTYSNIRPLLNQDVTLSFSYKNIGNALNFSSGNPVNLLNTISIPSGNGTIAQTFPMKYSVLGNNNFTRIVLFATTQLSSYSITIGNIKLEQGKYQTPFVPNPMYADILAIEQVYRVYQVMIRCLNTNVGDLFNFYYPLLLPNCFKNSTVNILINTVDIYSYEGIKQTGFTVNGTYLSEYNCAIFQAKKAGTLLKEIYLIINFSVDLRPY